MRVLSRAEPSDSQWTSNSARLLRVVATLGTVFAPCGLTAVFLIGFSALPPRTLETKGTAEVPVLSATFLLLLAWTRASACSCRIQIRFFVERSRKIIPSLINRPLRPPGIQIPLHRCRIRRRL